MSIRYHPHVLEPKTSSTSQDPEKEPRALQDSITATPRPSRPQIFLRSTKPLAFHCIMTLGVACFMLFFVDNGYFNLSNRRPLVSLTGGTSAPATRSLLLQSDVVTLLSSAIIVLRLCLGAWSAGLCWRSALFLMERRGLSHSSLRWLLDVGVLTPPLYARDVMTCFTGITLVVTLAANIVSPLLTGLISWVPSNQPAVFVPELSGLKVSKADFGQLWTDYLDLPYMRGFVVKMGAGAVDTAWGRNADNHVLKRAVPFANGLELNSTVTNITLPYFVVHSLQWIKNPSNTLTRNQRNFTYTVEKMSQMVPTGGYPWLVGAVMLIPTTKWTSIPNPLPATVSETRLMLFHHGLRVTNQTLTNGPSGLYMSDNLPPDAAVLEEKGRLYSFAWVTFSAGVSQCATCRLSGPSTVQNDTVLSLQEDVLTSEALALAPLVASSLIMANSSVPFPMNNINNYVEALLVRSYSGAWTALNNYLGSLSEPLTSSYVASQQVLGARVDKKRVFIWLGLQLSAALFGVLSIAIQLHTKSIVQFMGKTVLTAFYLDTTKVPVGHKDPALKKGLLGVRVNGDRLKVEVGK